MTEPCWYCGCASALLCDHVIGRERGPDRCEWDPERGALRDDDAGCTARATQIVGADGYVRVCDRCAEAPQLRRRKTRRPINPAATRPVTCDAAACRRCAARFGWRTVMSAIVCTRGRGGGCHDSSLHRCHAHAGDDPEAAPTGPELRAACEALYAERDRTPGNEDRWREVAALTRFELVESRRWLAWAGDELRARSLRVELQEHDLLVLGTAVGDCLLEVKTRPFHFRDPWGYPFPTALVETVETWNAKPVEPRAVLLVSRPAKTALVVSSATRREWTIQRAADRARDIVADCYHCPRSRLATLEWLVQKLLP
mgnify:CR=1 FL=1